MQVRADSAAVAHAGALLRAGGLVAFPTETVYGLGANAFEPVAVARIFEAKERPSFDPLIVHVLDDAMLRRVVAAVPEPARQLIERFWPGPLTLVLKKTAAIPAIVTAGLETVAVRSPAHPVARALLAAAGVPIAAPSANRFGALSPTSAAHVAAQLGGRVDTILDAGRSDYGVESSIVSLAGERPALLRHGALALEEIETLTGRLVDATHAAEDGGAQLSAPGQLASHYAPHTPLRVVAPGRVTHAERARAGLLAFSLPVDGAGYAATRVLSPSGDLREAAAALFAALHELDALELERIDAEPVPEMGLGRAVNDRLRRAAAR